jgi:anthranilate synthase/aminodeoxychorismate synthase-like glutamine amidotransferase
MILLIDNYDSFTHILAAKLAALDDVRVVRNDRLGLCDIEKMEPERIVLSPGPGGPLDSGICLDVLRRFARELPILGVCLGHQCIAHVFGGNVIRASMPCHGKTSEIHHDGSLLFRGIPDGFRAGRYHSLVADPSTLPDELAVTARTPEGEVMALSHVRYPLFGVQFHPESVLTDSGELLLQNFRRVSVSESGKLSDAA